MTEALYQGCSVGDLVVTAIRRGGDRVAFIAGDTQWTYRQLGSRLSQVIHALEARGLKRGMAGICIGGGEGTAAALELG